MKIHVILFRTRKLCIEYLLKTMSLRREVLKSFKSIHRTRCKIFEGDDYALNAARHEINKNYKQHMEETNEEKIRELIQYANEINKELVSNVIQFREVKPGKFQAQLRPEMFEVQAGTEKSQHSTHKCKS